MERKIICYHWWVSSVTGEDFYSIPLARQETSEEALALLTEVAQLKEVKIKGVCFTPEQVRTFTALPFPNLELICGEEDNIKLRTQIKEDRENLRSDRYYGMITLEAFPGIVEKYIPSSKLKHFKEY